MSETTGTRPPKMRRRGTRPPGAPDAAAYAKPHRPMKTRRRRIAHRRRRTPGRERPRNSNHRDPTRAGTERAVLPHATVARARTRTRPRNRTPGARPPRPEEGGTGASEPKKPKGSAVASRVSGAAPPPPPPSRSPLIPPTATPFLPRAPPMRPPTADRHTSAPEPRARGSTRHRARNPLRVRGFAGAIGSGACGNAIPTTHRHERRRARVWSCSSLILRRTSSIIGPHLPGAGEEVENGSETRTRTRTRTQR